jgi:CheY-like chemotaxis protein
MSHELRTPMNGVLAVAELLHRQPLGADAQAYVQTIIDSSETLLRVLSDAIDLSRADAAGLELTPTPTLLRSVIDDVQALWLPRAQQDGVTLSVSYAGEADAAVLIDPVRLKQVFSNLIGNALKFTRRGGVETSLHAARVGEQVRLTGRVRDTGPGIPAERLEHIFEPFAPDERGAKTGGAGLGLAICREIVAAMGGRVWAESNPGAGATFIFELEAPAASASERICAGTAETAVRPLGAHVLIVDDNATNRMVAETLVGMFGCTCECVSDGEEAVAAARARAFDAVLMDIKMPRMDGVEATRAIRALPGPAGEAPVIALTANADPEDAQRYLAAGMASVVEKPIKADRLFAALAAVLAPAAAAQEAAAA